MPRQTDGNYVLPSGNPVASGTIIQSSWANMTMDDIAEALSDSLDRYGRGGMLAPFKFFDGTKQAPGATWANEPSTGLYRAASGDLRMSVRANDVMRWLDEDAYIWDNEAQVWRKILTQGGQGGVPEGSADGQMIRWDMTTERWLISSTLRTLQSGQVVGLFRGSAVDQQASTIQSVEALPETPDPNTLYLVRN